MQLVCSADMFHQMVNYFAITGFYMSLLRLTGTSMLAGMPSPKIKFQGHFTNKN